MTTTGNERAAALKDRFQTATAPRVPRKPLRCVARFIASGPQCARRSREKRSLTEWEIHRKLERFKLHQIQCHLDGWSWPVAAAAQELEILLRAGIRPSRNLMRAFTSGNTDLGVVSRGCSAEEELDEYDTRWANYFYQRFRDEYARKFYGVKP